METKLHSAELYAEFKHRAVRHTRFSLEAELYLSKNISSRLDKGNIIYRLVMEKYIYIYVQ